VLIGLGAIVRAGRISAGLAAALAGLAAELIAPSLAPGGTLIRSPDESRYLYPGAIFALLIIVELVAINPPLRGRVRSLTIALGILVLLSALFANVGILEQRARDARNSSTVLKTDIGALQLARRSPGAAQSSLGEKRPTRDTLKALSFTTGDRVEDVIIASPAYLRVGDTYGSPGYSAPELREAPGALREEADQVLAAAIPIRLTRARARPPGSGSPPLVRERLRGRAAQRGSCLVLSPARARAAPATPSAPNGREPLAELSIPPDRLWIHAHGERGPVLKLGRLGDAPEYPVRWPSRGREASLSLPRAGLGELPWALLIGSADEIEVCSS
jgi:hypothetical protein